MIDMLCMRITLNPKCLASQFLKRNCVTVPSRKSSTKEADKDQNLFIFEDALDEKEEKAREDAVERERNKSQLYPQDFNKQHDRIPFETPVHDCHHSLGYKRRLYGKYGELSKVNPSTLWPSKIELAAMKEYEEAAQPFTLHQLISRLRTKKALEEKRILEEETNILEKVKRVKFEIQEFHKRFAEKKQKALELIEKKNRLIEQVRQHFGFEMDPNDEKFKTMLEKLQKEEKKKIKAARKMREIQITESQSDKKAQENDTS